MIILYEVELLKIYKNQSKHNLKIKLDLFVETISKIGCVTALFQLNIMGGKASLLEEKIVFKKFCNRFSIQIEI